LRDVQVWPVLLKFPLTECLGEKAALIILPFQLNNECTLQFCLRQDQCSWLPCSGRAQRSTSSRLGQNTPYLRTHSCAAFRWLRHADDHVQRSRV